MRVRPPFRILVIDSPCTTAELMARLASDLDADAGLPFGAPPGHRPWIGRVNASGLEMRRRTPFRNSFQPVVRARFVPNPEGGTRLRVSMSLLLLTRVVLGLWTLAATVSVAGLWTNGEPILWLVPAMLVAVVGFAMLAFNLEADHAEAYLRGLVSPAKRPIS